MSEKTRVTVFLTPTLLFSAASRQDLENTKLPQICRFVRNTKRLFISFIFSRDKKIYKPLCGQAHEWLRVPHLQDGEQGQPGRLRQVPLQDGPGG